MQAQVNRKLNRRRIRYRVRKKIEGTAARPRVAVFRSLKHIYAQAIDDSSGRTLACASSRDPQLRGKGGAGGNREAAKQVGTVIVQKLKDAGIDTVIFDRGGFLYHGRVRALADAMREGGLKF
jgi:large subunit ribosomal protein L18